MTKDSFLQRQVDAEDVPFIAAHSMTGPTISVLVLRHVANCLDLIGSNPEPLLTRFRLRRDDLEDAKGTMPLADFLAFFELAAAEVGNPYLGLQAGRLGALNSLGPLGFLFLSAPTLGVAFAGFSSYLATIQDAIRSRFTAREGIATFEYVITDQTLPSRRQDAEFSIALMHNMCRSYVGAEFELIEVRFEHACPGDGRVYRDFFRCNVFFDQDTNAFAFEDRFLDHKGGLIDSGLYPIIEEYLGRRSANSNGHSGPHKSALHRDVIRLLETSPLDRTPTLEEVARKLAVSVATLNRKLRAEGVRWRGLVHERRMYAAARLLKQSKREVAEIALSVGFSESASFVRSFARHFGTTPKRYREAPPDTEIG